MQQEAELAELARVWRGPVVESVHGGVVASPISKDGYAMREVISPGRRRHVRR